MKLPLRFLQTVIDLPSDVDKVRRLLDDLGLEVKGIQEDSRGTVYTIETLANRGDHLSVIGVAREFAARTNKAIKFPAEVKSLPAKKTSVPIRIATDKCHGYALLEADITSPISLGADVAPFLEDPTALHPVVSILNFAQAEMGQPMHAFDRDKVEGEVAVELTEREEQIEALDKKTYTVPPGSLVIKDKKKIIAVAGVIGCANSMVTEDSKHLLFESALFCPVCVRKTARKMGLITDAAYAFERGVDPQGAALGLKRVAYLLRDNLKLLSFSEVQNTKFEFPTIEFSLSGLQNELGNKNITSKRVAEILAHLGYSVKVKGDIFKATIPSWRTWDVESVQDIVEDIARSLSFSEITPTLPPLDYTIPSLNSRERLTRTIEPVLLGNGFLEVITKSYYSAKDAQLVESYGGAKFPKHLALKNSLESSYSHLKATNLVSMAQLAEYNHRRGVQSAKIFELGQVFGRGRGNDEVYEHEVPILTIAQSGRWNSGEWRQAESREQRVSHFTGLIEQLFAALRAEVVIETANYPLLHPGCQGVLKVAGSECGFFGLIHPGLQQALDVKQELLYAELDMRQLAAIDKFPVYQKQTEFPAIRRDLTLQLGSKQFASTVVASIKNFPPFASQHKEILSDVCILDDFKKPGEDFRRVSFRVTFQSDQRTLEHALIDELMNGLFAHLKACGTGVI